MTDWNERNQLVDSADASYTTTYVYGQDGQRSNKYTKNSETLYFNKMWTHRTDSALKVYGGQTAKNIYLGETRIVTKLNAGSNPTVQEESDKQYFYSKDFSVGISFDHPQIGISSSVTADICLGVIGTYDLNNSKPSGMPNSLGFGSVGGGVWKTWTVVIPIHTKKE